MAAYSRVAGHDLDVGAFGLSHREPLVAERRPRTCWDKAAAESVFATLETELHRPVWPTRQPSQIARGWPIGV